MINAHGGGLLLPVHHELELQAPLLHALGLWCWGLFQWAAGRSVWVWVVWTNEIYYTAYVHPRERERREKKKARTSKG